MSYFSQHPSVPTGPYRELQEGRITPDEYASQVRREVRERIREEPPPRRPAPANPPPLPPDDGLGE
jgi:hypothetical protein